MKPLNGKKIFSLIFNSYDEFLKIEPNFLDVLCNKGNAFI